MNNSESLKKLEIIFNALDDKQAEDIKILDVQEVTVLAEYFVIAHGNNPNHVKSLIDTTEDKLAEAGYYVKHVEGNNSGTWVLLDYGDIIVHIFGKEDRYFYDLERMWSDGKEVIIKETEKLQ